MAIYFPPPGYARISVVHSFDQLLIGTPFADGVNALCWPRALPGDFGEVASSLAAGPGITTLSESRLRALRLSAAGRAAVAILIQDQQLLRAHGLDPELNCIHGYLPPEHPSPLRTDVRSFHVDSATEEADTWLCTYHGPASEGLRNEEAQRHIEIPSTRARLLQHFGGPDSAAFRAYLTENFFDLHYASAPHARPFTFGQGHLWRIATAYPASPVPPCIHRAPDPVPGQPPRLLLIS